MKTKRYLMIVSAFFFFFSTFSYAYTATVRDQKVVDFFVENLITMVDTVGTNRVRDVLTVLQRMQLRTDSERETYILREARETLGGYFSISNVSITLEGDDDTMLGADDTMLGADQNTVSDFQATKSDSSIPAADQILVTTFFQSVSKDPCGEVVPVEMIVPRSKQVLRETVLALLRGPRTDHYSGLGSEDLTAYLLDVQLEDGVAYIDFDRAIMQSRWSSSCGSSSVLAMLEQTVTDVRGVEKVLFAFDGSASAFYEALQRGCPYDIEGPQQCDHVFSHRSVDTTSAILDQRGWRLWSNDYSVYTQHSIEYDLPVATIFRVCGTGHGRCVHVFDFPHTIESLGAMLEIDDVVCKEQFVGRLQRCQLSDTVVVSTISPWKQLVILRDGPNAMTQEDLIGLLEVIGQ